MPHMANLAWLHVYCWNIFMLFAIMTKIYYLNNNLNYNTAKNNLKSNMLWKW